MIENGIYQTVPTETSNTMAGKLNGTGSVFVRDGATLEVKTKVWSTTMSPKKVHVVGRGYGERGALSCHETFVTGLAPFGFVELDGDVLVMNHSSNQMYFGRQSDGGVTVGAHTLTVGGSAAVGFSEGCSVGLTNPGSRFVATGAGMFFVRQYNGKWNFWQSSVEMVVTNSSTLFLKPVYNYYTFATTLYPGASIYADSNNTGFSINQSYNRLGYNGGKSGLYLLDPDRNAITFARSSDYLIVSAPITGGGLSVGTTKVGGRLALTGWTKNDKTYTNNTFTNGIVATKSIISATASGLIPASGKALVLNDSTALLSTGVAYTLPPLEVHGSGVVTNGTGTWRQSVVKDGTGELVYGSLIGSDKLDVQGGTVRFVPQSGALPVFATVGGAHGGTIDFADVGYTASGYSGVPVFVNTPSLAITGNWTLDVSELPDAETKTTSGTLSFSNGAVLTLTGDVASMSWRRREKTWVVAWAEGGITGMPTLVTTGVGTSYQWSLTKSSDGKKILLWKSGEGTSLFVK